MIQSAKNEVLDFGLLDWLDIAYDDGILCFPPFGNTTRSWRIIQKSQKSIFEWSEVPNLELGLSDWLDILYYERSETVQLDNLLQTNND